MSEMKSSKSSQKAIQIVIIAVLLLTLLEPVSYLIFSGTGNKLARLRQQGNEYLMQEDYESAKEEFKKALELSPKDIVIYFDLAEAYIGLENYMDASVYLEQALAITEAAEPGETVNTDQYVSLSMKLAECYSNTDEEYKRAELLKHSFELTGSERIKELLAEYYPDSVTSDVIEGVYEVEDSLEVHLSGSGLIFYTLDGSEPSTESKEYSEVLSLPVGVYKMKAVAYNEYGFRSEVSTFRYTVLELEAE